MYPDAGSATSAGTYRRCMEGIRAKYGDQHRVIITEAGLTRMYKDPTLGDKGWLNDDAPLSEEQYWQSLNWYNGQMLADDYVLGACLYEVGHHGDWRTFRHVGKDNQGNDIHLIDRIVALKEARPRSAQPAAILSADGPAQAGRHPRPGHPARLQRCRRLSTSGRRSGYLGRNARCGLGRAQPCHVEPDHRRR